MEERENAKAAEAVVHAVAEGQRVSLGAPSLLALAGGKLLAAFDQTGPGVKELGGNRGHEAKSNRWVQGRVMLSGDGGATWRLSATYPFRCASLFRDGGDIYLAGEMEGALVAMRSPDGGGSWSAPQQLTERTGLRLSPTRPVAWNGAWWLPAQAERPDGGRGNLLLRAAQGASLLNRKAWIAGPVAPPLATFLAPAETMQAAGIGLPCGRKPVAWGDLAAVEVPAGMQEWLPDGGLAVTGATASGRCNWCAFLTAGADGSLSGAQVDGAPWRWLPLPGGHAKFSLFHDAPGKCFVAVGHREAAAMRPETAGRMHRLGIWFSANLADWTYGGNPLPSGIEAGSRWAAASAVSGNDLCVAYRYAPPAPEGKRAAATQIRFVRVANFRQLRRT